MTERSRFWDGTVLGDSGPYTTQHVMDQVFRSILNGTGNRGVLFDWLNDLEVTSTGASVSVNSGGAIVYGIFYENDTAAAVSIPTPSSGFSRYDRIVIRRDWSVQTARIARVAGVAAAAPAVPSLTQTVNVIWEIPLATVLIDDAGTITVTDTREYCQFATSWPANTIDDEGMFEEGAVTPSKIPDRTRYELKGSGQIEPDSGANPCTWVAGASYDYWQFADAAFNYGWVYFLSPTGVVGGQVNLYVWSVPDVNGAGAGAENCEWDYSIYYGDGSGAALANTAGTVSVDQQARVNTTVYRDQVPAAAVAAGEGQIIAFQLGRDGAADSYNSAMRLLGIEMEWTADA